jgi:hypothetical protein
MFVLEVCQALDRAKVAHALVGGYAVALHGAVRGTVDVDLVLSLDEKAFIAAEKVFAALGLKPRLPIDASQVFRFREEYIRNRNLIAWSFVDPARPVRQLDVIITEDLGDLEVDRVTVSGVRLRVVSIPSLITMKKRAGRPQDVEDVKALQALLDSRSSSRRPK